MPITRCGRLLCVWLLAGAACTTTPLGRSHLALFPEAALETQASALYEKMRNEQTVSKDGDRTNFVLCVSNAITNARQKRNPSACSWKSSSERCEMPGKPSINWMRSWM